MYGVNYQEKDYKTIFESYFRKAAANKLINNDEQYIQNILNSEYIENILIMEMAIHSEILAETYKDITNITHSYDITKATGTNLDQLLEPFLPRREHTYATTEICFTKDTNTTETQIEIPPGTTITSSKYPEIEFQTLNTTTISDENNILIKAICTIPGAEGNIPQGELNTINTPLNGIKKVHNPQSATGGRNKENDENYRSRGQKWTNINTHGTYAAFKNAIEDIATVKDYYIQRQWDGPGTTRIIINPPTEEVLDTVNKKIKEVCAIDEEYTIIATQNTPINIHITATIKTYQQHPPRRTTKNKNNTKSPKSNKNIHRRKIQSTKREYWRFKTRRRFHTQPSSSTHTTNPTPN